MLPSMDFETFSTAGYYFDKATGCFIPLLKSSPGLKCINASTYAMHPSTEIICLFYNLEDGRGEQGWWPWMPEPVELTNHIRSGGLIEAHNSIFEWYIWYYKCHLIRGWAPLPLEQMRCSQAKGRAFGLPGALEKISEFLTPEQVKDPRGKQLINLLSKPCKPTKKNPLTRRDVYRFPELHWEMGQYCAQDVRAEKAVSAKVPELSPFEFAVWQLDQRINSQGVAIDVDSLNACIEIFNQADTQYTAELRRVTGDQVNSIGEISKGSGGDKWLISRGINVKSLDKKNIDKLAKRTDLPPDVKRVIEIKQLLGSSSAKKIFAVERILNPDNRIRDLLVYSGAEKTQRWAGRIFQPQNLKNHGPESLKCEDCGKMWAADSPYQKTWGAVCPQCGSHKVSDSHEWGNTAAESAIEHLLIYRDNLAAIEWLWGNAVELIASLLRSLVVAADGYDLICSDYSAIEAVGLAALAREEWRLEVFRTHGKIYEMSAASISGIPFDEIMAHKAQTGKHHPLRKSLGKVAELGSGYGGWINAWKNFGADKFMNDAEIKENIIKWRKASPNIVEFWGDQWRKHPHKWEWWPERYGLEGCAINAMEHPQYTFGHNDISFRFDPNLDVLFMNLPSGRALSYHQPRLAKAKSPAGNEIQALTFFGRLGDNSGNWGRRGTYGGRLTENACQAACRDIQAAALVRVDAAGYRPVLHVHDEIISEVPKGWGSVEEFEKLMMEKEPWFSWWPIKAASGWRGLRYRK